jgi:hypothetical protein
MPKPNCWVPSGTGLYQQYLLAQANKLSQPIQRHEGEGCQQADVPFALGSTLGNFREGGDPTEPNVVDPSPGLADGGEQSIAALGLVHPVH